MTYVVIDIKPFCSENDMLPYNAMIIIGSVSAWAILVVLIAMFFYGADERQR